MINALQFRECPTPQEEMLAATAIGLMLQSLREKQKQQTSAMICLLAQTTQNDAYLEVMGEDPAEKTVEYEFQLAADLAKEIEEGSFEIETTTSWMLKAKETSHLLETLNDHHLQALLKVYAHRYWSCIRELCRTGEKEGVIKNKDRFLKNRFKALQNLILSNSK